MATVKSLEGFLKDKARLKNSASAKSLSEYLVGTGINPIGSYASAVKNAIQTANANSGAGALGETLGRSGLTDDGYATYLAARAEADKQTKIATAEGNMAEEYRAAQSGYSSYLERYKNTASSKMSSLERQLVNYGIMRLEETYAIGIENGLSPEDAATVSANVYRALRNDVYTKCLTAARNSYMDESGLRSYAERAGLLPDDIDELIYEARFNLVRNK